MSFTKLDVTGSLSSEDCNFKCSLSFDYGGLLVTHNISYDDSTAAVVFEENTYEFDKIVCYKMVNDDNDNTYQLELEHIGNDNRTLTIVIPFTNASGNTSLDLKGNIALDDIVPKEAFWTFYFNTDSTNSRVTATTNDNICIFFSSRSFSLHGTSDAVDAAAAVATGINPMQYNDGGKDTFVYHNAIGTKTNGLYSSADDIYIDCSPVGESEEDIIYSKKRDTLNDYVPSRKSVSSVKRYQKMILSSENKQMVYGMLAGLLSIAFFNKTFTKLVKIN
jgi:hypothetical protein